MNRLLIIILLHILCIYTKPIICFNHTETDIYMHMHTQALVYDPLQLCCMLVEFTIDRHLKPLYKVQVQLFDVLAHSHHTSPL